MSKNKRARRAALARQNEAITHLQFVVARLTDQVREQNRALLVNTGEVHNMSYFAEEAFWPPVNAGLAALCRHLGLRLRLDGPHGTVLVEPLGQVKPADVKEAT